MIMIRGGGDLASGVALRLYKAGMRVVITELRQPLAVRRLVSFAEAVYQGETNVENVAARRVNNPNNLEGVLRLLAKHIIPVIIDPMGFSIQSLNPSVIVDARMRKEPPEPLEYGAKLIIGLGPGFVAGQNCNAAIETNRGHLLGRVIWKGAPQIDTGIPESVGNYRENRVLRAPTDGYLRVFADICQLIEEGQVIAEVNGSPIKATFNGVLRGILHDNQPVRENQKIGDLDPRGESLYCSLVSEKALAVGGGVLEAILSREDIRNALWR